MSDQSTFIVEVLGEGEPVILIPGIMSNGSVYQELAHSLSSQYQLHIISVKGFAGVPHAGAFSLDYFVDDIADYIKTKKLNKPCVVGHSMGGVTAFKLACKYPDLISKLISIDGLPFIGPIFTHNNAITVDMLKPQAMSIKTMYSSMNQHQLAMQAQTGVFFQATSAEDQAKIVEMARTSDPLTAGNAMYDVLLTDLREPLKQVKAPILMLGASGSFNHGLQHQQIEKLYTAQFADVSKAKIVMNDNARHFIMYDDCPWLLQQIEEFLGSEGSLH